MQDPFPHEIGSYFTNEQYAELLINLPADDEYKVYPSYPRRYLYQPTKGFWKDVLEGIAAPYEKYRIQLCRDFPGYQIGPHTDGKDKERTFLFYLATEENEKAGTSLFRPIAKVSGDGHHDFSKFQLVKTVPYKPNTYLTFARSDRSFHGVFPCDIVRNVIQLSVLRS